MSTPWLVLSTTYRCSPPGRFWGSLSIPCFPHVKPKWILSSGKLWHGTTNSVRNRQKKNGFWYPEIPNKSVYADDLIFKKREKLPMKNIYILKYLFAWVQICSWEQGGDCRWDSTFSITSSGLSGKLLPALEVSLPIKLWTSDKISWGPFSPQIHGFLLDVNGESSRGRSPFLRRFLAEMFSMWLPL